MVLQLLFELSMFLMKRCDRTFSGKAWRDGVWSICWEGVTHWGDGLPLASKSGGHIRLIYD